jgi:probable HAF family extracellular repeat protein
MALGLLISAVSTQAVAQRPLNSPPYKIIYPTFTTIDVAGWTLNSVNGINTAGDMVGYYGSNVYSTPLSGFLYSNGAFTYFDYPGQSWTIPGGINDSGLIAGYATQVEHERTGAVGFLYDGITFATLQDGNNPVTYAYGINNAGTVVGAAGPDLESWKGFEEKNGKYKTVPLPGQCPYAEAEGINNLGLIVSWTACGTNTYAYKIANGKAVNIQFPGAPYTYAYGVNDNGIVVGSYNPASATDYAFALLNGKYVSFQYPGAIGTYAYGINNSGQVVGQYELSDYTYHGFVTSPIAAADFEEEGNAQ